MQIPVLLAVTEYRLVWEDYDPEYQTREDVAEGIADDTESLDRAIKSERPYNCDWNTTLPDEFDWSLVYEVAHGPWRPGEPRYYGYQQGADGHWRDKRWLAKNVA